MVHNSVYDQMTRTEKEVALLLKDLGIFWRYEKPLYVYDDKQRPRVWSPDFYLVHFGIYIEVCGSKDFDYEYRRKIYEKNEHRVIFLHMYKDSKKWKNHLFKSIELFMEYRNYRFKKIRRG